MVAVGSIALLALTVVFLIGCGKISQLLCNDSVLNPEIAFARGLLLGPFGIFITVILRIRFRLER